jgi:hypothetical protein
MPEEARNMTRSLINQDDVSVNEGNNETMIVKDGTNGYPSAMIEPSSTTTKKKKKKSHSSNSLMGNIEDVPSTSFDLITRCKPFWQSTWTNS